MAWLISKGLSLARYTALTLQYYTRLRRFDRDKHSSLFVFTSKEKKCFKTITLVSPCKWRMGWKDWALVDTGCQVLSSTCHFAKAPFCQQRGMYVTRGKERVTEGEFTEFVFLVFGEMARRRNDLAPSTFPDLLLYKYGPFDIVLLSYPFAVLSFKL
jgi:hypothetical protein